jgi:exodeoxyribonuclease VII small subunit
MPKQTFEQSIKKLEQIVQELESGDLPLERALQKFEDGIQLSKHCAKILDETEKRVTLLLQEAGSQVTEQPFPPEDDDG